MLKKVFFSFLAIIIAFTFVFINVNTVKAEENKTSNNDIIMADQSMVDKFMEQYFASMTSNLGQVEQAISRDIIVTFEGDSLLETYLGSQSLQGKYSNFSDYALSKDSDNEMMKINKVQDQFVSALNKNQINYTLKYNYSSIVNAVSINVSSKDIAAISKLDNVKNVIYSEQYSIPEVDAISNEVDVYTTGIYNTDNMPYKGTDMLVAVLDTGLDYTHQAFQKMPSHISFDYDKLDGMLDRLVCKNDLLPSVTTDDLYLSDKVPFAFDYADIDADVFPTLSYHGTHVAGIIGGYDDTVTKDDYDCFDNGQIFKGSAPDCQLAIFKVFSDKKQGAATDDILAALADCAVLGVDVINMSLGSSAGFSREKDDSAINAIYDNLRSAGINLVVAASNSYSSALGGTYGTTNLTSNPDSGTIGSPATYDAAIAVGSIDGQLSPYLLANGENALYFHNARNSSSKEFDFVNELLNGETTKTYNYVVIGGYGKDFNYTASVKRALSDGNTIAVVKRGDISFEDKQKIAAENGAIGCIIYNNVSGTINASLGTGKKIPTCTVSLDDGAKLIQNQTGTITISKENLAGPFMSDFSSWGPSPDLELKPEITAHGGNIISAVVGGYDSYSGTSMAAPNFAGLVTLFRQYVYEKYGEMLDYDKCAIADLVYEILMSTATIANNAEGNPYSPRKQGAGLADIYAAMSTEAYLHVVGSNKTKLSLGDDKSKTGTYTLRFNVNNLSNEAKTYIVKTQTMTETVSSDGITVAEKAHMLDQGNVYVSSKSANVKVDGMKVTVDGNSDAEICVVVSLTKEEKQYIDANFENGMFVEGFVQLVDTDVNGVDLSIPWLAFYGDWLDAPVFDASIFEVADDKFNDAIEDEDKKKAALYETIPVASYYQGSGYLMPLGKYVFNQPDGAEEIKASVDKIAVTANEKACYEVYAVYAGMLRSAKYMKVIVTNDVTGEVVYEALEENIRKSYGAGAGTSYPAGCLLNLSPKDMGLDNNTKYNVKLTASLDYENGDECNNNTFEFSFYVDDETPSIVDYNVRTEVLPNNEKHTYLDLVIHDNHYLQSVQICSIIGNSLTGYAITMLDSYPTPANSSRNSNTKMTFEITNYLNVFENEPSDYKNRVGVYVYDYALNGGCYLLPINFEDVGGITATDEQGNDLQSNPLQLKVGDIAKINIGLTNKDEEGPTPLEKDVTITMDKTANIKYKDGVVYALKPGIVTVTITSRTDPYNKKSFKVVVTERTEEDGPAPDYQLEKLKISSYKDYSKAATIDLTNGVINSDCGNLLVLYTEYTPWYATNVDVTWRSLNEDVCTVDEKGYVKCVGEGTATIWAQAKVGALTLKTSVKIVVGKEYTTNGQYLYRYNGYCGTDGFLQIPDNLGVTIIGHYNTGNAGPFYQNTLLTSVIIPEGVETIGAFAFTYCSNLETVYLPSSLKSISSDAFKSCTRLKNIYWITGGTYNPDTKQYDDFTYQEECNAKNLVIGSYAFAYDSYLKGFDLSKTTGIYDHAFSNCSAIESVDLTNVKFMGLAAFTYCSRLKDVKMSENTMLSRMLFWRCTSIERLDFYQEVIPNNICYAATSLSTVVFHNDVKTIENQAFSECTLLSNVVFEGDCESIGYRAFDTCTSLSTFDLPSGLKELGQQAFLDCNMLVNVSLARNTHFETLGSTPFDGCERLVSFSLPEGSKYYKLGNVSDTNGKTYKFLYDKNTNAIVLAPTACPIDPNTYKFTDEDGNLLSTEIGAYAYAKSSNKVEPEGEVVLVIPEGITSIGDGAFMNNAITKVILPSTLTYLGAHAFDGCTYLKDVVIKSNLKEINPFTFFQCSSLTTVEIPNSVTFIGESAFRLCSSLVSINIPSSVEVIDLWAFATDVSLESLTFEEGSNLKEIGKRAFTNNYALKELVLPEGLEVIGEYAFTANSSLAYLSLPSTIETFGNYTFANCTSLTDVDMAEGLRLIGNYCFVFYSGNNLYYNPVLKNVNFASTIEYVGYYAFSGCTAIKEVSLPSVKYIFGNAFLYNKALKKLTLSDNVEYIGQAAFYGCESLVDPDLSKVKLIDSGAFYGCTALESGNLESCEIVGAQAFYNCSSITELELPNCRFIYGLAFINCKGIQSIYMPKVEIIGEAAFFNAIKLEKVKLPKTLEKLYPIAFAGTSILAKFEVEEGNETYFADESGVLYRTLPNGMYELVQYPAGSKKTSYTILDNTVRVAEYGMAYAMNLRSVVIDKEIKSIGAYAFYGCGLVDGDFTYTFKGQFAPALEGMYADSSSFLNLYSNFSYKIGYVQMNLVIPSNGYGYDGFIYDLFFKDPILSNPVMEEDTKVVFDYIEYLASVTEFTEEDVQLFFKTKTLFSYLSNEQKALCYNSYKLIDIYDKVLAYQSAHSNKENASSETEQTKVNFTSQPAQNGTLISNNVSSAKSNTFNTVLKTVFLVIALGSLSYNFIRKRY